VLLVVAACCAAAYFTSAGDSFVSPPLNKGVSSSVVGSRQAYTKAPLVMDPPEEIISIKQRHKVPSAEHLEYAIVEFGAGQHMVHEGGMYETKFMRAVPGAKVRLNRVLLLKQKNRGGSCDVSVGQPFIDGAYAEITILEHLLAPEQVVYRHAPKKHFQRRWIHQEKVTRFRIDKIVKKADDLLLAGRAPYPLANQGPKFEKLFEGGTRHFEGLDLSQYTHTDDPTERGMPADSVPERYPRIEVEPAEVPLEFKYPSGKYPESEIGSSE